MDKASSESSTESIRECLSSRILAKYSYIYSIAAFDKSGILARRFFESVIDLEFPLAFLESARLFDFSNEDFVCFDIVLFDHFSAILVNID